MNSVNRILALLVIAAACPAFLTAQLTVQVSNTTVCAGGDVTLTASGTSADGTKWSSISVAPPAEHLLAFTIGGQ